MEPSRVSMARMTFSPPASASLPWRQWYRRIVWMAVAVVVVSVLWQPLKGAEAVKAADFKTCQQCGFCKRHRAWQGFQLQRLDTRMNKGGKGEGGIGGEGGAGEREGGAGEGEGGAGEGEGQGQHERGHGQGDSFNSVLPSYYVLADSVETKPTHGSLAAIVQNTQTHIQWTLAMQHYEGDIWHLTLDERHVPPHGKPRYRIPEGDVVDTTQLSAKPFILTDSNQNRTHLSFHSSFAATKDNVPSGEVVLHHAPFQLEVKRQGHVLVRVNQYQLMHLEHQRQRSDTSQTDQGDDVAAEGNAAEKSHVADGKSDTQPATSLPEDLTADLWSESFNGHKDPKDFGPMSLGMDISFPGFSHVYGLPEHASRLNLKNTRGDKDGAYKEPYRFYNVDIFEYELDSPMALYGSVPFAMAVKPTVAAAVLWLNPTETWVDVWRDTSDTQASPSLASQVFASFFGGNTDEKEPLAKDASTTTATHWFSESGIVNLYIFTAPTVTDIYASHTLVTGRPYLPPAFSLAYHQCRWNYKDMDDVARLDADYDTHDLPLDVVWLDIEHTKDKAYFTWHPHFFPRPGDMIDALADKGRKMVTIIDPHIKVESGYYVQQQALAQDHFVHRASDDTNAERSFSGHCWPGNSMWVDYTKPAARSWWSSLFAYDRYEGSRKTLFTWNDMNEPSVFGGPEVTMPKNVLHHGDVEHREIHNLYGMLMHRATFEGHVQRSMTSDHRHARPFVLSRAFFSGTQRYGPIWTGDNMAKWDHMRASIPMLLSLSIAGITFCGADVGGFFGNPETELLVRWYQVGAYTPFFRAHAHIETARREPYLFDSETLAAIRQALRQRYLLLPYWYTLFYEASVRGAPPMRPLWSSFQGDPMTYDVEDAFMVGDALLVHPVSTSNQQQVDVYLPGDGVWYDFFTGDVMRHGRHTLTQVTLQTVPVYVRGGSILPMSSVIRRASSLMWPDDIALLVAADAEGSAEGTYYYDDGETNAHDARQEYLYSTIRLNAMPGGVYRLINTPHASAQQHTATSSLKKGVQRIALYGFPLLQQATAKGSDHKAFSIVPVAAGYQEIKLPLVDMAHSWQLYLH